MPSEVGEPSSPSSDRDDQNTATLGVNVVGVVTDELTAIRASWSAFEYEMLLSDLQQIGPIVGLPAYAHGQPGVWLRHDVELDADAALVIAQTEHRMGLASTYFVCADSPFLHADEVRLLLPRLRDLGHEIGLHRIWGLESTEERWHFFGFMRNETQNVTFHAPGVPPWRLAAHPAGAVVYSNLANGVGSYASDSTGRWRWGNPKEASAKGLPLQVLTHPFWWSGGEMDLRALGASWRAFLPQIANPKDRNAP